MLCAAASASRQPLPDLLTTITTQVRSELGEAAPDLAVVFLSNHFEDEAAQIAEEVAARLQCQAQIGCSGEGVIGPSREHRQEPALALWAACLSAGARASSFNVDASTLALIAEERSWREHLGLTEEPGTLILLADPFTTDIGGLLAGINDTAPGWSVFGGMVSGAEAPGQAALIANGSTYRDGIVGVALNDRVLVNPVVSQGCRPIGKPYIVTKADRRIIYQLGGQNPLRVLEQIFEAATPEERSLMRQGVLVGQAIKETQPEFRRGDFLIRHLHNAHPGSGAIGVSDAMRVGVTVQFHVRDAASADEDLRALVNGSQGPERPSGALLFSGNGRGTRLFPGLESHDVGVLRELVPDLPVAGFTCAGELGPLGGKNFIHGQTASIAFFRSRNDGPIPAS